MKASEIRVGSVYRMGHAGFAAKILAEYEFDRRLVGPAAGQLQIVTRPGWLARDLETGRTVRIHNPRFVRAELNAAEQRVLVVVDQVVPLDGMPIYREVA